MSDHAHHVIVIPDDGDYTENKSSTDYEMMSHHLVERDMRGSVMPDSLIHPIREDFLSGMSFGMHGKVIAA